MCCDALKIVFTVFLMLKNDEVFWETKLFQTAGETTQRHNTPIKSHIKMHVPEMCLRRFSAFLNGKENRHSLIKEPQTMYKGA